MKFSDIISPKNHSIAVLYNKKYWKYSKLFDLVTNMNSKFPKPNKSLILVLGGNNIETVLAILLSLLNKQTIILLDELINVKHLNNIKKRYDPDFIWSASKKDISIYSFENYSLKQQNSKIVKINPLCSMLLSTSGTTGTPKFVRLSSKNLENNANDILKYLKMNKDDIALTLLPLYYSFGLSILSTHLLANAQICLGSYSLLSKKFWNDFNKLKPTSFSGVPYHYELLKKLLYQKLDWSSIRIMTQAGGRMDTGLMEEFAGFTHREKIKFFTMYGQTEASPRMSFLDPVKVTRKFNSIGQAVMSGRFELLSRDSIEKKKKIGELVYYGKNVMLGYSYSRDDLNKGDELKGRLATGDIATIDNEQDYIILGRKNRMIKILGLRINPEDIEEELTPYGKNIYVGCENDKLIIASQNQLDKPKIEDILKITFNIPRNILKFKIFMNNPRNSFGKIDFKKVFN